MQKLQNHGGSGVVTIPRDDLEKDDLLDEGELPDEQHLDVDRLGRRTYVVRIPEEGGNLPELAQCEVVERLAAKRALDLGVGRGVSQAD
ncbi:hypothetical protein [Halorubrum sodomense]|uniref:DUF8053 domain-containing protein n=1 Tax=Halorubrum sodomense TaxID=35743 RepID=A0A1I6FMU8_HALSD|nr:hypothetical protein [Halorubrum sodomense]SFR31174.1 hypothetical protein SAMN04487937_1015 [Halorubrum sodomense]